MKQLSLFEKGKIVAWSQSGESARQIAPRVKRDHRTISRFLKNFAHCPLPICPFCPGFSRSLLRTEAHCGAQAVEGRRKHQPGTTAGSTSFENEIGIPLPLRLKMKLGLLCTTTPSETDCGNKAYDLTGPQKSPTSTTQTGKHA